MAEFNPYKLEEEKWTPKNVYQILPPNSVSWSDYDFGQGTDNVDGEAAKKSFVDGFVDFFKDLFGVAGQILGGALELGGKILGGFVEGVIGFIGGVANAIGSIFGGGPTESPYPPMFSPIKANLEAAIQPFKDQIQDSKQKSEELLAEQLDIRGQIAEQVEITRAAVADAKAASERAGVAITEAEAAVSAAEDARQTLEDYNTELNERITTEFNSAVGRANTAVEKAETLAGELADFQAQHQVEINNAIGKAEQAVADLATLSPKVTDAVDKAGKASSDVTALTTRVSTAEGKVATAEQNVAALTPKVTDAVTKSDKAVADVAALNPKVTAASNKATQAASDVADLTPKVTAAQDKADKAASDLTTLTPKVTAAQSRADAAYTEAGKVRTDLTPKITAAQSKADTAVADLTKLEPKVTAAQSRADSAYTEAGKVRTEVTPKIEAAQTKGESALAVADTAVDWLKNPTEIGTSVIAVDPETKRPYYANHLDLVDDNPPGTSGPTYMSPASMTSRVSYGPTVPVDPKIKYTISFWAKASVAGSIIYGQFESQEGTNYSPEGKSMVVGAVSVSKPPQPSNRGENGEYVHLNTPRSYFIDRLELSTEWTYYEHEIQFAEGVTAVRISAMFWSQNRGVPADQYISGLDIRPQIPTQASVDKAQNDAIKANADILVQQGLINEAQRVANLAQKNFNDNQTKWNLASTNATKANTELLRHQGLINDAQAAANLAQKNFNDNQTKWNLASTNATKALADAAKAQTDINAEQTKFNNFQTDFNTKQTKWNTASTNATKALADSTSALEKIAVEQGKLNALQSDFNTKQTKWNQAVDRSIATQGVVNDNFKKWSDGATEAIEANKNAIKALNAPQIGSSIVPLVPGTKIPVWQYHLTAIDKALSSGAVANLPEAVTHIYRPPGERNLAGENIQVNIPNTNVVMVDPTIEYEASWWTYSTSGSARYIYVTLEDDQGNPRIVEKTDDAAASNYTSGNPVRVIITPATPTWTKYTTRFRFKEGTQFVRFANIYFSNTNNTNNSFLYIADLHIGPKIPKQQDVDSAQNDAISANTEALKALGKKVLGASLVPYKTPSTQEVKDYAAGNLSYDPWADLEYIDAGHYTWDTSRGRVPAASSTQTTKSFSGSLVSVDPTIGYRVKFSTWADEAGSKLYVYMLDQDGNTAVAETPFTDANKASSHLISDMTLPKSWKDWSGVIKFKPGVTQVKLGTFYWNHSRGTITTRQALAGLEIVPNIPDANVVNELQDNAIRKNTAVGTENKKAIDALTEGMEAYVAAADLEALHKDIQDELEKEQDARAELAAEINNYMVESIPRTIIYGSGPQFNDHISAERYKIIAKPGWVGQMLLDVTYVSKSDGSQTKRVITNYNVPDTDGSREYDVPNASFGGYQPAYRLDYWIYRGKSIQKALSNSGSYITGSSFTKNSWTRIATHTIKKSNGAVHILWRTRLTRADRGVTYSFDVRVNGTSVLTKNYKGYGPLTSLGSGVANLSFSGNLSVPDNGKIEVYAKASGTTNQASVSSNKGTLTYLELE